MRTPFFVRTRPSLREQSLPTDERVTQLGDPLTNESCANVDPNGDSVGRHRPIGSSAVQVSDSGCRKGLLGYAAMRIAIEVLWRTLASVPCTEDQDTTAGDVAEPSSRSHQYPPVFSPKLGPGWRIADMSFSLVGDVA